MNNRQFIDHVYTMHTSVLRHLSNLLTCLGLFHNEEAKRGSLLYTVQMQRALLFPLFVVYSKSKPTSFDLLGDLHRQGWMDAETFRKFIQHLHTHAH